MITSINSFKPYTLKAYGKRHKYIIRLKYVLIGLCIITPFTNMLIPLIHKYIKGHICYIKMF